MYGALVIMAAVAATYVATAAGSTPDTVPDAGAGSINNKTARSKSRGKYPSPKFDPSTAAKLAGFERNLKISYKYGLSHAHAANISAEMPPPEPEPGRGKRQSSCSSHSQCSSSQYCDEGNICYACGYCVNVDNDAIDGTCPSNCNPYRTGSSSPPPPPSSSSGECSQHTQCADSQYCDSANDCYACGYCVNVQNDAVDGTCPSNCNAYRESSSGSSSGDCSAHSECSSVQYCDSNRDCYACSYCVNVFNDAIDGTCPSSCDSARTGSSGGSSSSDSGGSSSSGSCSSTEGTGRDSGGDDCSWYANYQDSCGSYDDSNFRATEMCCACGGGAGSGSSGSSSSGGNSCVSTEGNGRDSGGDSCTWYSGRSSACGNYDDSDFIADQMCCGCSGGAQSASASAAAGPPPPTVSAHPGFCNTEHNGKTNPCDQGDFCCDDDCTICGPRLYCRTFSGQPSPYSECASGPTQRFGFEDRKCEKFVQPDVWCVQRQKAANLAAALEAEEVAYSTFYIAALVLVVVIEVAGLWVVLSTNDELGCMQVLMVLIFGIRSFDMFSDWAFFAITFSKSGSFAMQYTDAGHDFDSLWNTSLAFAILGTLLYFPDLVGFYTRINDGASAKEKKDALWITASVFAFEDFPQLILNGIYLEFTGFDDADPISIFAFVMSLLSLVLNCGLFWSEMGESYEIGPLAPSNGRTHIGVLEGGAGNANAKTDGFGFGVADAADEDDGYLQVDGDVSVGDRVAVEGKGNGVVRFVGPHAAYGTPRIGVELDDPVGKNNGTVKGHTYFTCNDNHGSLVSTDKITLL